MTQPTFFVPPGGGPCFFMDDPAGTRTGMAAFLRSLPKRLPEQPRAILLVSCHWETDGIAFTGATAPSLIYDYRAPSHRTPTDCATTSRARRHYPASQALSASPDERLRRLAEWEDAPAARLSHQDAEHPLPLMVAAGALDGQGTPVYSETVMDTAISGFRFD